MEYVYAVVHATFADGKEGTVVHVAGKKDWEDITGNIGRVPSSTKLNDLVAERLVKGEDASDTLRKTLTSNGFTALDDNIYEFGGQLGTADAKLIHLPGLSRDSDFQEYVEGYYRQLKKGK